MEYFHRDMDTIWPPLFIMRNRLLILLKVPFMWWITFLLLLSKFPFWLWILTVYYHISRCQSFWDLPLHSPTYTCSVLDSLKYVKAFPNSLWASHSLPFPVKLLSYPVVFYPVTYLTRRLWCSIIASDNLDKCPLGKCCFHWAMSK